MEKYGTAGLATQHNTAHALFMLDNQVYTLSLSLSHTHTQIHTHTKYKIRIALPR